MTVIVRLSVDASIGSSSTFHTPVTGSANAVFS